MEKARRTQRYIKFGLYLAVVVLLNIAGASFFFRADLTADNKYSLSDASKQALARVSGPLTIKVFFTKNLPPPHNATERYLHDLLGSYALYADRHLSYQFHDVTPKEGQTGEPVAENQALANDYGIYPVQVRNVEADEVKFQKAYMGMVIIYGDMVEKIDPVSTIDGLEYRITTAISRLTRKVSAFADLDAPVKATLYLSSSLYAVAPYLEIDNLRELPGTMKEITDRLNVRLFDAIAFETVDLSTETGRADGIDNLDLIHLKWPEIPQRAGKPIPEGEGAIGLVLTHKQRRLSLPLLNVVELPIFGTRYSMPDAEEIEDLLDRSIESLVGINDDIGFLAGHGTLQGISPDMANPFQPDSGTSSANFRAHVSENYTIRSVDLATEGLDDAAFACLVIAGPTEPFSDYELFQIDQYLMRGHSLALFLDPFKEVHPQGRPSPYAQPAYVPLETGIEKLLAHYGVTLERSVVMDESCFKQPVDPRMGGGEQPIYFAPLIKNEYINHEPGFMKNIRGLVAMQNAPLVLQEDKLEQNGIAAVPLFSSSDQSWEQRGRISLNPMFLRPPGPDAERESFLLACLLDGAFPSYFAGKPVPSKPPEDEAEAEDDAAAPAGKGPAVEAIGTVIEKGRPGKIFVMGSSHPLRDYMVDREGRVPNAVFLANVIDALNGREAVALLRSKQQTYNPLNEVSAATRTAIKGFNIIGLPVLVVMAGLVVLLARSIRKKRIARRFAA
ncbi:MAG: Gldg family protein [Thermodesulfobacteriota bacterium]|nr:Gldg family protein [Thermodesulfobacteriota bacterium]